MITTQKELRRVFWETYPALKQGSKKQNDYPTDTRVTWCDFIEHMQRDGQITETLANRATL